MRLIDADVLWERLDNEPWFDNADRDEIALPIVDAIPTVDAEVVVRCKDCEYSYDDISSLCCSHGVCVNCEVPPNFYCAGGKRKEPMGKQSAFVKAVQREVNIQLQIYGRNRMQLAEDAAFMAANEVLGLGSGRARAFGEAFVKYANEIADLVVEDSKADDEIVYAKTVLDRRIREIVGEENFSPFDERYGRR